MKSTRLVGISLATPSPSGSAVGSSVGGASILSLAPSSTIPEGVVIRPPCAAATSSGSTACRPISFWKAPTTNSRIEIVPPWAKKGRTRRSGSTPATREVSTVPSGWAVMVP